MYFKPQYLNTAKRKKDQKINFGRINIEQIYLFTYLQAFNKSELILAKFHKII